MKILKSVYQITDTNDIKKIVYVQFINSATKHFNAVILSNAKNLASSCCYEILHGACPERNDKILRCAQNDKAKGSG
jgi:hypothetical protein